MKVWKYTYDGLIAFAWDAIEEGAPKPYEALIALGYLLVKSTDESLPLSFDVFAHEDADHDPRYVVWSGIGTDVLEVVVCADWPAFLGYMHMLLPVARGLVRLNIEADEDVKREKQSG
jgi:hypothetical protein